jgi:hypothetical protein
MAQRKHKWFLGALGLLAAGAFFGRYSGSSGEPAQTIPSQVAAAGASDVQALQRRLHALEAHVRRTELRALQASATEREQDEDTQERAPGAREPAQSVESDEAQKARYWSHVDSVWENQEVDRAWAPDRQVSADIARVLPSGSRLNALECRTSMCRIELAHPDIDTHNEFMMSALVPPASMAPGQEFRPVWQGMTMFKVEKPEPGKPLKTVAYFVRADHELPPPDEEGTAL